VTDAAALLVPEPTSALAVAAHARLLAACNPPLVGHCERSFQFAAALAREEAVEVDLEVLYVGTILHDLGLSPTCTGPARFEVRGANQVRAWLIDEGMDRVRAEVVWDVIALHASGELARHKSPETAMANRGISVDIRGVVPAALPPEVVRAVLDAHPRHGFASAMVEMLVAEVRAAPDAVRLSWLESIAVRHVPGYPASDFEAVVMASEGFV
jgi:HD domain